MLRFSLTGKEKVDLSPVIVHGQARHLPWGQNLEPARVSQIRQHERPYREGASIMNGEPVVASQEVGYIREGKGDVLYFWTPSLRTIEIQAPVESVPRNRLRE